MPTSLSASISRPSSAGIVLFEETARAAVLTAEIRRALSQVNFISTILLEISFSYVIEKERKEYIIRLSISRETLC
jgi:hypothetical protein